MVMQKNKNCHIIPTCKTPTLVLHGIEHVSQNKIKASRWEEPRHQCNGHPSQDTEQLHYSPLPSG